MNERPRKSVQVAPASVQHVALLVDDDADLVAELGDFLRSFGHDHLRAATQAEALEAAATGRFCYALVDLEIRESSSAARAWTDGGQELLRRFRALYPRRRSLVDH